MQEKISQINELNINIKQAKEFLSLLESSNIESKYKNQIDNFSSFTISSYICTGDQSPKYTKEIEDRDIMNSLSEVMKIVLKEKILEKEIMLNNLIN